MSGTFSHFSRVGIVEWRCVFPLHELYVAAALLALIITGLYFLLGAWGAVLLWSVGALFAMCLAGTPFLCFFESRDRFKERQFLAAAGYLLGALVAAALWLGAVGYCGYRAYLAIP